MIHSFRFLTQFTQSPEGKLWETPPALADTGNTPVAATPATPTPQSATPTAPVPASGTPPEDRTNWVPPYRIRETREAAIREARQAAAQEAATIRAEADRYKQQLQALVGVQAPQNTEQDAIKQQFYSLFPKLKALEEQADELTQLRDRAGDLQSQNDHYWQSYGRQQMDKLFSKAADSYGAPLNDEGKSQLHTSFIGWLQASPERQERYASDPSIVEDFWKAFTSSFIDPARRTAATGVAGRAAGMSGLPQDTPSGAPRSSPVPQPASLDERAALAWQQYQATSKV